MTIDMPDQFLYSRKGPWPQPSPSHPLICADEVLHIPPMEELLFNQTIGKRYLEARIGFPAYAAMYAASVEDWKGVTPERFDEIMTKTLFTRFKVPMRDIEMKACREMFSEDDDILKLLDSGTWSKYDFTAMDKVDPLDGTHCAGTKVFFRQADDNSECVAEIIEVGGIYIARKDSSFGIAMLYGLQGAAYHVLFVVHPALHFPMDSVNAITKTSMPMSHPLFQMLLPHSAYSLALDNAVLESAESVVNNNAQGTRFDPLTANGYNLKLLFGAGYAGLGSPDAPNGHYDPVAYPRYDYLNPMMHNDKHPLFDSFYGKWLAAYYEKAFLPFAQVVAKRIRSDLTMMTYTEQWAQYLNVHVHGFPTAQEIGRDDDTLAHVLAIYNWNASVSHGGDHWSFANEVTAVEKCLRIRRKPPASRHEPHVDNADPDPKMRIFSPNDMQRASLCQYMFFQAWAIKPNLAETRYAFASRELLAASVKFQTDLKAVNDEYCQPNGNVPTPGGVTAVTTCQPLYPIEFAPSDTTKAPVEPDDWFVPYVRTIPASIQY